MKIQISAGEPDLAGFLNIDVTKHQIDLGNLDNVCDNSECTEIFINDVLKYIPYEHLPRAIAHITMKLRHGGLMTVVFTDLNTIVREYMRGAIGETMFNKLAYENGANSCCSYGHITTMLKGARLELQEVNVGPEVVIIKAKRP
jgi:predicted SAM-dependent methyltransferase